MKKHNSNIKKSVAAIFAITIALGLMACGLR